jgi:hypothetical protein
VFVVGITPEQRAAWQPQLNEEHSAWRWFKVSQLALAAGDQAAAVENAAAVELHPVVDLALRAEPYKAIVLAAAGSGG